MPGAVSVGPSFEPAAVGAFAGAVDYSRTLLGVETFGFVVVVGLYLNAVVHERWVQQHLAAFRPSLLDPE